jgi:diguanylate cyclase (GGDEF)-like protein
MIFLSKAPSFEKKDRAWLPEVPVAHKLPLLAKPMQSLIDSVADLTALRDRDELEIIVVSVMFDLIGASELLLWRLVSQGGEVRLRLRAKLENGRITLSEALSDADDFPVLESRMELRECFESRAPLRLAANQDGQFGNVFPVINERGVIGFLEIYQPMLLRDEQERLVSGLLRIYRNHLRILDYSENDELTGLLNRKTFDDYFGRLVQPRAQSQKGVIPFERIENRRPRNPDQHPWLAVVDIDFFKRINDRFGHLYGDEVLVLLARLMRCSFRETDRLFRCGGEEFIVILESTEAAYAEKVFENFRAAVEIFQFPQVGRVTVSIGYTCIIPGDNGSDAFGRADQALYIAKENGRNQVRSYENLIANSVLQTKAMVADSLELF